MLLLTTVLPSVVLRGSCDLKGLDFQLWIASLSLREKKIISFNLNFYSELYVRGCTKPDLRDDGKYLGLSVLWFLCKYPSWKRCVLRKHNKLVHNWMKQVISLTIPLDLLSQALAFFCFSAFIYIFEALVLNQ